MVFRLHNNQSGAAFLELAISAGFLLTLIFGTVIFGLLFREQVKLIDVARTTARIVAPLPPNGGGQMSCDIVLNSTRDSLQIAGFDPDDFRVKISKINLNEVGTDSCSDDPIRGLRIQITRARVAPVFSWLSNLLLDRTAQVDLTLDSDAALAAECEQ